MLYHMGIQGINDPAVMEKLEENIALAYSRLYMTEEEKKKSQGDIVAEQNVFGRFAWGAVIGYYKGNFGSAHALKYWEHMMITHAD